MLLLGGMISADHLHHPGAVKRALLTFEAVQYEAESRQRVGRLRPGWWPEHVDAKEPDADGSRMNPYGWRRGLYRNSDGKNVKPLTSS